MPKVFLPEMTWMEVGEVLPKVEVAIIPTGSTEQHGPHLPFQVDIACALHVSRRAAEAIYPMALVTTPVAIGLSPHHMGFPGSLSLQPETYISVLLEICGCVKRHGVRRVAIVNGHAGNGPGNFLAARRAKDELGMKVASLSYWDTMPGEQASRLMEGRPFPGHADEFETSLALAIFPEHTRMDLAKEIDAPEREEVPPGRRFLPLDMKERFKTGVASSSYRFASAEKGRRLLELAVEGLRDYLRAFVASVPEE